MILLGAMTFASGYFSASETALFSISSTKIKFFRQHGDTRKRLIANLVSRPSDLLVTILILNIFTNIIIQNVASNIFGELSGWLLKVGVPLFLTLVFGEIIPKVYATRASLAFSKFTVYPLNLSMKIFLPICNILIKSTSFVNKRLKMKKNISVEDLSDALELTEADIEQDKGILERIVTFGTIDVKEIMKPRVDVVAADINYSFNKLKSLIIESGYSRIPIYEENHDNRRPTHEKSKRQADNAACYNHFSAHLPEGCEVLLISFSVKAFLFKEFLSDLRRQAVERRISIGDISIGAHKLYRLLKRRFSAGKNTSASG